MRNILIIANTFYQLIVAIQLNNTVLGEDKVTVLLSNHSNHADKIQESLKDNGIFYESFMIETKGILKKRTRFERIADIYAIAFRNDNRYSAYLNNADKNAVYDELICFNLSLDVYGMFSVLIKNNPDMKVSMYEEGVLSYALYPKQTNGQKLINFLRHSIGKERITDKYSNFYCFYPELYHGSFNAIKIPAISQNNNTACSLRTIFGVSNIKDFYLEKYIFFTSVYDFEGGAEIGEYNLVCKVADLVGIENLLIKTHPRDTRTVYRDAGFHVDSHSDIPWEVIQLSGDFSDKVFLTVNSGSVLAGSFMSDKPTKTFYLYQLCDLSKNPTAQNSAKDIYNLLSEESVKETMNNVFVANSIEDILQ